MYVRYFFLFGFLLDNMEEFVVVKEEPITDIDYEPEQPSGESNLFLNIV